MLSISKIRYYLNFIFFSKRHNIIKIVSLDHLLEELRSNFYGRPEINNISQNIIVDFTSNKRNNYS